MRGAVSDTNDREGREVAIMTTNPCVHFHTSPRIETRMVALIGSTFHNVRIMIDVSADFSVPAQKKVGRLRGFFLFSFFFFFLFSMGSWRPRAK